MFHQVMDKEEQPFATAGRVAIITGGQGDLARAIAAELGAQGYQVLAPGRQQLDVTNPESVAQFFRQAPQPALLINNAGITRDSLMAKMSPEHWQATLDVNLTGAFACSQAALRALLRAPYGHIVNIGSYGGLVGNAGQTNYSAAKAGLLGMTRAMAAEYGARGLRVNCILPGYLKTKMTAGVSPEAEDRARAKHLLGRFNTPAHVAQFVVTLDSLLHVSGQHFQLDSRLSPWA